MMGCREKRLKNESLLWTLPGRLTLSKDATIVEWCRPNAPTLSLTIPEYYPFHPPMKKSHNGTATQSMHVNAWIWAALSLPGLSKVVPLGEKRKSVTSLTEWTLDHRIQDAFLEMEFQRQYPKWKDVPLPYLNYDLWFYIIHVSSGL